MDKRVVTWRNRSIISLIFIAILLPFFNKYFLIISLILIFISGRKILLRIIFTGPGNRKPSLNSEHYHKEIINIMGNEICYHHHFQSNKSDLVVFLHGWQSSSSRFENRMNLFRERGYHTMIMDMRGHGDSSGTYEWTAGKVINDIKEILKLYHDYPINYVHFYGHSLGGFVTLGLQHERHTGWWKSKIRTIILESPMTGYSPILEEMSGKLRILVPYMRKLSLHGFNKLHPEVGGINWEDIDVPNWGIPSSPTLILQSKDDNRLGRIHYDMLLKNDFSFESHLIESLPHSGNQYNEERDELIVDWIENPRY